MSSLTVLSNSRTNLVGRHARRRIIHSLDFLKQRLELVIILSISSSIYNAYCFPGLLIVHTHQRTIVVLRISERTLSRPMMTTEYSSFLVR